ncbi:alpha/beta hydrolase [Acidimangrovimonas pyrenivorans]|uniref:Alpha/beta hydrolase n=1 Tax=Acidimangrovimonas pyrenivorans TaxID=2030798 RepID=A0ABV7AI76_9RHOB
MTSALATEAALPRARLDADYSARATVTPEVFEAIMAEYRRGTEAARALPGTRLDLPYDVEGDRTLDLYGAVPGELRPVFLFIHGGYWRALSKAESGFMAPMLAAQGIACAVPDYRLAPTVGITEIVREMRAALAWLWHNAAAQGIDRDRIFVGGSSAGGHLAGTLLAPGWQAHHGLPEDVVCGALPVSGLYDLAPIAASHVQDWMGFTAEEVAEYSPIRHLPRAGRVTVALAAGEAAGFTRQSRAYAGALTAAGIPTRWLEVPARNHFDVILDLADAETALSRALLEMIAAE